LQILRAAVVRYSNDASILTRFGDALYQTGQISKARDAYRRAVMLDDSLLQAWYGRGMAEYSLQHYPGAIECFRQALAMDPRDAEMHFYLGTAMFQLGEVDAAVEELLLAAKAKGWRRRALSGVAVIIPGSPSFGNQSILDARRKWATLEEKFERPKITRTHRGGGKLARSDKLRIGYVSSFFTRPNWMKPVWGVINHHDRSHFEIHLFADGGNPQVGVGYQADASDVVHDVTALTNRALAERISRAGIDVLVDLNGYSSPNRLGVFMHRPARTVVGWFNMYASTGVRAFRYIIGDAAVIPPDEEPFYSERVLRVASSYLAFSVLYPVPAVVPPPCLSNGYVTFGCLAPQYKITREVIAAWARILQAAPTARLVLKNTCFGNELNRAFLLGKFGQHGVAPERLLLEGPADHYDFLCAYNRVDIALDTFPYNGGTTTTEALWQGVPVLTFHGDRWVSRISHSILLAAGLENWVEPSLEAYIQRAIEIGLSPEMPSRLASLREIMRSRLTRSAACDTKTLCRELEQHYRFLASRRRHTQLKDAPDFRAAGHRKSRAEV
jgi:predicted O-linked N-acetylglucosamine transferase (SPINDLY family)